MSFFEDPQARSTSDGWVVFDKPEAQAKDKKILRLRFRLVNTPRPKYPWLELKACGN